MPATSRIDRSPSGLGSSPGDGLTRKKGIARNTTPPASKMLPKIARRTRSAKVTRRGMLILQSIGEISANRSRGLSQRAVPPAARRRKIQIPLGQQRPGARRRRQSASHPLLLLRSFPRPLLRRAGEGNRTPDLLITSDNLLVPIEGFEALLVSEIRRSLPPVTSGVA